MDLLFDWFGLVCLANENKNCQLSYNLFQSSQTGDQPYSDTSCFSIPWRNNKRLQGLFPSQGEYLKKSIKCSYHSNDKVTLSKNDLKKFVWSYVNSQLPAVDKLYSAGLKLGRVFNFRSGCLHPLHSMHSIAKLPYLELKAWPRKLLVIGSLPLVFTLNDRLDCVIYFLI